MEGSYELRTEAQYAYNFASGSYKLHSTSISISTWLANATAHAQNLLMCLYGPPFQHVRQV